MQSARRTNKWRQMATRSALWGGCLCSLALAAKAIVDKRMTLDGDFRSYLGDTFSNLAWDGVPITLRWLVTHRSGMPRDVPDTDAILARDDFHTRPYEMVAIAGGYDLKRTLAALHRVHLQSSPGEKESYSNAGFLVIGFGLQTVYRESLQRLLSRIVLQPLAMTSTGFSVPSIDRSRLLKGYDRYGRVMPYHVRNAGAAWGLYSSTEDMAKFVRWQLQEQDPVIGQSHQVLVGTPRRRCRHGLAFGIAGRPAHALARWRELWHECPGGALSASARRLRPAGERYVPGHRECARKCCSGAASTIGPRYKVRRHQCTSTIERNAAGPTGQSSASLLRLFPFSQVRSLAAERTMYRGRDPEDRADRNEHRTGRRD